MTTPSPQAQPQPQVQPQPQREPSSQPTWYSFTQTQDQLAISFTLPADSAPSAKPKISIQPDSLSAHFGASASSQDDRLTFISGTLFARVLPHDSLWQIEKHPVTGLRTVTIHLEKESAIDWPVVISESDPMDSTSCFYLAQFLEPLDPPRAFDLYTRGAQAGNVACMLKVAAFYEVGNEQAPMVPVCKDLAASVAWHKKAAHAPVSQYTAEHVAEACYILASAYQSGHGLVQDVPVALALYDRAMDLAAGVLSGSGSGSGSAFDSTNAKSQSPVTESPSSSKLAPVSQLAGDAKLKQLITVSAFQVGLMYFERQAYTDAHKYWDRSAANGHPQSLFNLGVMYLNGRGVDRDLERALELMHKGVEADHTGRLAIPEGLEEAVQQEREAKLSANRGTIGESEETVVAGGVHTPRGHGKKQRKKKRGAQSADGVSEVLVGLGVVVAVVGVAAVWYFRASRGQA
ncbi:hypothetical protein BCR44DRAFT_391719 [Catenaria anguillulae PL171]|uniref:CS domain-containing protein n=1 Tax=Catenaria anguillulae PL171 TaxID=765915 RepID=A0A1Y2HTZ0_9FUNG|nr:hypothetical protein BCR44DRAFT_391719 [Catenaria anguillulae PL171]